MVTSRILVVAAIAAILASVVTAPARAAPTLTHVHDDVARAVEALRGARTFEDHAISIDAHVSDGVKAFRVIYAQPDAAALFKDVAARGSIVGQLYAAVGLRALDDAAFDTVVSALASRGAERVPTRFGCLGGEQAVAEILESRAQHAVRLGKGRPSMHALEEQIGKHPGGAEIDIVGGGYTVLFAPPQSTR